MNKKRLKEIKRMRKNRYKLREIGEKYGISRQAVWNLLNKGNLTKS